MQRQELELAGDIGKHSQSQRNYEQNLAEMTPELWRVSDCDELVGVNQISKNHPLNSLKPLSKRILLNEFESSEGQN